MKHKKTISILVILIVAISAIATFMGIFTDYGAGHYEYESIRGKMLLFMDMEYTNICLPRLLFKVSLRIM
jgi:phosphatidylglycerophosphate synthase